LVFGGVQVAGLPAEDGCAGIAGVIVAARSCTALHPLGGFVSADDVGVPGTTSQSGRELLTAGDVSALLRVSTGCVGRLRRSGMLPAVTVTPHRNFRYRQQDVDRFIEDRLAMKESA